MPPLLALLVCLVILAGFFVVFARRTDGCSVALVIPLVWLLVVSSRSMSTWFSYGVVQADNDLEGSPIDRAVYFVLIAAALVVLRRRRVDWAGLVRKNIWMAVYFGYALLSVMWSAESFVAFKRWFKDVGNIAVALVILTEGNPYAAVHWVMVRFASVLLLFSALFNKYFPDLSRYYDQWTYQPFFAGVTTDKNMMGMGLFASTAFLAWRVQGWISGAVKRTLIEKAIDLALLVVATWLFIKTRSSTAIACTVLTSTILLALTIPFVRKRAGTSLVAALLGVVAAALLNSVFHFDAMIAQALGRDLTFTGRVDIWSAVLNEKTDPIFGVGFYSFWSPERVDRLSSQYYFLISSAHNGYLETYLNMGCIGVLLLLVLVVTSVARLTREHAVETRLGSLFLACFLAVQVYATTEAVFDRLGPVWFLFVLSALGSGAIATRLDSVRSRGPRPKQIFPAHRGALDQLSVPTR